jgi:starch synthase
MPVKPLRVVMAAMEMSPLVKIGGLGDVVRALSDALVERGHDVTVILPAYRALRRALVEEDTPGRRMDFVYGGGRRNQRLERVHLPGARARLFLLDDPAYSRREGIYVDPQTGEDYPDASDRYAVYVRGVLELLLRVDLHPDVLHAHDFQTALLPTLLKRQTLGTPFFERVASVLTIHNLGYQGIYDPSVLDRVGLNGHARNPGEALEFWGKVNFLKAGIVDADLVTTVSPRYAEEIRTRPEFAEGLQGVLASRGSSLAGILNGIDTKVWDPANDPFLPVRYDRDRLEAKLESKRALLERAGLGAHPELPVVGMVTRLVEQKGIDLLLASAGRLLEEKLLLVVLGSGRRPFEDALRRLAAAHPGRVFYEGQFDDPLAHLIEAGADIFLMPSRYEPCGLNQMMSLRYGTVPVVHRVGGLADTVRALEDDPAHGLGFVFDAYTTEALVAAVGRALGAFRDRARWREIQRRGMAEDFTWGRSASRYEAAYADALAKARHRTGRS